MKNIVKLSVIALVLGGLILPKNALALQEKASPAYFNPNTALLNYWPQDNYSSAYRDYTAGPRDYSSYHRNYGRGTPNPNANKKQNEEDEETGDEYDSNYEEALFNPQTLGLLALAGGAYYLYSQSDGDDDKGGSGGGSGGGNSSPYETAEYKKMGGLGVIKASAAYDAGFSGKGILVAVVDDGFETTNVDLAGNMVDPTSLTNTNLNQSGDSGAATDVSQYTGDWHGSFVASIIAGVKNNIGMHGVAYSATLLPIKIGFGDDINSDGVVDNDYLPYKALQVALDNGSLVVNNSHGVNEGIYQLINGTQKEYVYAADTISRWDSPLNGGNGDGKLTGAELASALSYWNSVFDTGFATNTTIFGTGSYYDDEGNLISHTALDPVFGVAGSGQEYLNVIKNMATANGGKGTIIVWAAGNEHLSEPSIESAIPYLVDEIRGMSVVSVAIGTNGKIAGYSDWCGVAKEWCIAAPGYATAVDADWGGYSTADGTSFSAGYISGAAAILLSAYPNLTASEVVKIMFESANKSGTYSNQKVYGQGLLDLAAAIAPLGKKRFATSNSLHGPSVAYDNSKFYASSAISLSGLKLASQKVFFLDKYDRKYEVSLADVVSTKQSSVVVDQLLANFGSFSKSFNQSVGGVNFALSLVSSNLESEHIVENQLPKLRYLGFTSETNGLLSEFAYGRPGYISSFALTDSMPAELSLSGNGIVNPYLGFADEMLGVNTDVYKSEKLSFKLGAAYSLFSTEKNDEINGVLDESERNTALNLVVSADYKLSKKETFGFNAGVMNEFSSMLGSTMSDGFGLSPNTKTYFGGFNYTNELSPALKLFANYSVGHTTPETASENSLIKSISDIQSSSFAVGLSFIDHSSKIGSRYGLIASSPLTVTSGRATFFLPVYVDYDTEEITSELVNANLAPSSREFDVEAFWSIGDAKKNLSLGLMQRFNADNVAGMRDTVTMIKYNAPL